MKAKSTLMLLFVFSTALLNAGIPEPDSTFMGTVMVAGKSIGAHDNVSIIARISGEPETLVGAYRMGDNPEAADSYVLKIRLESLADGGPPSPNAARVGQAVDIFIKTSNYLEIHAATVTIRGPGQVRSLDLHSGDIVFSDADVNTDGIVNMEDLERLAGHWGRLDCAEPNLWCDGADIDHRDGVNLFDLLQLATSWLKTASY